MGINEIKQKLSEFAGKMNKLGIPIPVIRDPSTGVGSVSLTLVFISFNIVLVGLIGKASGAFGGIDLTQALNLFYACAALYWGRQLSKSNPNPDEVKSQPKPVAPQPKVDDPDQQ